MKCIICDKTIGVAELRSYVHLYKGDDARKTYACNTCQDAFDRWIDALPTDENGNLIDVSYPEAKALLLATDRRALEKRLRAARAVLQDDIRREFGRGHFDFDQRILTGDNGVILRWKTRVMPDQLVTYSNQQTSEGHVQFCQNSVIKIIPAVRITGCHADCPNTRFYEPNQDGETKGCSYKYGTLPKEGVPDWCPLYDEHEHNL